jgi:membrane-associated protein
LELLAALLDWVLHLDAHLVELLRQFGPWVYAILFAVVFAETGLVVMPFLPGDSLLFAAGALAAVDTSGTLGAWPVCFVLIAAAVLGNTVNYHMGRWIGPPAFSGKYRWLKVDYLRQAEAYFHRYGGATITISRFVPIVRTCAPFVAGVARMAYGRYQAYNVFGGAAWVLLLVWAGYWFGNIPVVRQNFGLVTLGIIAVSLIPLAIMTIRSRLEARAR